MPEESIEVLAQRLFLFMGKDGENPESQEVPRFCRTYMERLPEIISYLDTVEQYAKQAQGLLRTAIADNNRKPLPIAIQGIHSGVPMEHTVHTRVGAHEKSL